MKKKFSYKDVLYKSKRMAVLGLALVLGVGIIAVSGSEKNTDIPVHDGEVLVDSLTAADKADEDPGNKDEAGEPGSESEQGSFEQMRAGMELERNKLIANLDSTINNSKSESEKKNASEEKARIMDFMEKELSIEKIIESKNLPDSYVIMTESGVNVTVDKQELDTNTVAKICDIVMRETGLAANKIVIQSKY